jgi:hypothetical protein
MRSRAVLFHFIWYESSGGCSPQKQRGSHCYALRVVRQREEQCQGSTTSSEEGKKGQINGARAAVPGRTPHRHGRARRLRLSLIAHVSDVQIEGAGRHGRLSDFDQVSIRVAHVAPQFRRMDFWLSDESSTS